MKRTSISRMALGCGGAVSLVASFSYAFGQVGGKPSAQQVGGKPSAQQVGGLTVDTYEIAMSSVEDVAVSSGTTLLSQINIREVILKDRQEGDYIGVYFTGFSNNQAVFLLDNAASGIFYWFDPATGRQIRSMPSSARFYVEWCRLSSSGKSVFTTYDTDALPAGKHYLNDLLILDATTLEKRKELSIGQRVNLFYPSPVDGSPDEVALPVLEFTWDPERKLFTGDPDRGARIEIWNWVTGRKVKSIPYSHAPGVSDMVFNSDGKSVACLFKSRTKDRFNDRGIMDILDAHTGKTVWHIEGSKEQPVGEPYAFLSPNEFVVQNSIYNTLTKKVVSLFPSDGHFIKFVGNVPGHRTQMFFSTRKGLELWDWSAKRAIRRWPNILDVDKVTFSQDLTIMSVEVAKFNVMQFWKFKPLWVK
jgi:hypothetical protein